MIHKPSILQRLHPLDKYQVETPGPAPFSLSTTKTLDSSPG
jgi:hypothetical protein